MNIVYITNNTYFNLLYVSIYSLLQNNKSNLNIYIIYYKLKDNYKKKLKEFEKENIKINLIRYKEKKNKNKKIVSAHITKEAYLKLKLNKILKDKEKFLYIDCDTIISNDIKELYDVDISNYSLGVVLDKYLDKEYKALIKIKNYFNSGMLLVNNNKLKKIYKCKSIKYHDQDILNITYKDNILLIDEKYNYQIDLRKKLNENLNNKIILHYLGPLKPIYQKENKYNVIFYKYAKETSIYKNIVAYQKINHIFKYPIKLKKKIKDYIYNNF